MNEQILQSIKDFAPVVSSIASLALLVVTISSNRWQGQLEREKLRHSLSDRRMKVYNCFLELLFALRNKSGSELRDLTYKAMIASQEVLFLFEGQDDLRTYLQKLCIRIHNEIISNKFAVEELPILQTRREQLEQNISKICDENLPKLPEMFAPFLKLTDSPR